MKLDDINNSELEIGIKVELENEEVFIRDVKKTIREKSQFKYSV